MIDYKELFKRSKELSKKYQLTQLELYQRFMFERVLERISVSEYNENFILKGGLLLTAIFGIKSRTTRDMDTTIKGIDITKEKMVEVLDEILAIDLYDNVKFEVVDINDIRADDEYGGNKYHIVGKLENLKVNLEIDISTGDSVIPRELKFEYPSIFEDKKILIESYNIETILAEKIETVLRRGQYNARMKDYYDIYFFLTKLKNEININTFKKALNNTIKKRKSEEYMADYIQILDGILAYARINTYWENYKNKNVYAKDIEFANIVSLLKNFLQEIEKL